MRTAWNITRIVISVLLVLLILAVILFSAAGAIFLNRSTWDFYWYRAFTVETDMDGGGYTADEDIAVVELVEPEMLQPGDVIFYRSEAPENYGKICAYALNKPFSEEEALAGPNVLGRLILNIPRGGELFSFLKTDKGFALGMVLPAGLLFVLTAAHGIVKWLRYRKDVRAQLQAEAQKVEEDTIQQEQMQASCEAAEKLINENTNT